jgi:thiol-disulfide isomerase/thioredoxin
MSAPKKQSSPPWLWIGVGAVVVVALVIAVIASAGGSSDDTATDDPQTQPVTVTGNPLPTLADSGADPGVGQTAPTLAGTSFDGSAVDVKADGTGKLVLFVAHWCPHCQREVPLLVDHLQSTTLPAGVELVTVATATDSTRPNYPPQAWLDDEGWPAPVLADSAEDAAAQAYGLPGFPYLVALDGSGKVVGRITGEFPMTTFDQLARAAAG